jgi:hypothetical protein
MHGEVLGLIIMLWFSWLLFSGCRLLIEPGNWRLMASRYIFYFTIGGPITWLVALWQIRIFVRPASSPFFVASINYTDPTFQPAWLATPASLDEPTVRLVYMLVAGLFTAVLLCEAIATMAVALYLKRRKHD